MIEAMRREIDKLSDMRQECIKYPKNLNIARKYDQQFQLAQLYALAAIAEGVTPSEPVSDFTKELPF